jgi:hypothetical protein
MEAIYLFETSGSLRYARGHNPGDHTLHSHHRENLRSKTVIALGDAVSVALVNTTLAQQNGVSNLVFTASKTTSLTCSRFHMSRTVSAASWNWTKPQACHYKFWTPPRLEEYTRSRGSAVGMVNELRAGRPRGRSSSPSRGKIFLLST